MNTALLKTIQTAFSKRRQNVVVGTIQDRLYLWESWYKGNVNDFHRYKKEVNGSLRPFERLTLNLPKKMCEDFTSYIWNEKSNIKAKSDDVDAVLQNILEENDFYQNLNNFIEEVEALGGGVIVSYISNGKVVTDFITADNMLISRYKNNMVNGIVTVDEFAIGEKTFAHVISHDYVDSTYRIEHYLYNTTKSNSGGLVSKNNDFSLIFNDSELAAMIYNDKEKCYYTELETPYTFFEYFKTALKNNWDRDTPYGISRFANAIDDIKRSDMTYDVGYREIKNGESKLFFDSSIAVEQAIAKAPVKNASGEYEKPPLEFVKMFDVNQENFLMANGIKGETGKAIESFNPQLRCDMLDQSLTKSVNLVAWKFGFGNNYYEVKGGAMTAKEVIHSDSQLWRSIVKAQNLYMKKLQKVAGVMLTLQTKIDYDEYTFIDYKEDINVNFDDSIIIDDESQKEEMLQLIDRDMMPKYEYLIKFMGMTKEQALKTITDAETAAANKMALAFGDALDPVDDDVVVDES